MKAIACCSGILLASAVFFSTSWAAEPAKSAPKKPYEPGCDPAFAASYPLSPKLMEIPANQQKLLMEYPFRGDREFAQLACRYTLQAGEKTLTKQTLLNTVGQFWIDLSGMPLGLGKVTVEILDSTDSSVVNTIDYTYKIVPPEAIYPFEGKELSSLVSELVNQPLEQNTSAQFNNFREGWVYVAVAGKDRVPDVSVTLDGKELLLERNDKARTMEAFRKLPAGRYTVQVSGKTAGNSLIVRNVPMLFSYPLCRNSYIKGNPPYDYEFHKKYIFPAGTAFCGGDVPVEHQQEFRASGREIFVNIGATVSMFMADDQQKLTEVITNHPKIKEPLFTGITIDELFMDSKRHKTLFALSKYLKDVKFYDNKPAYTWIVGTPPGRGICARAISAMVNATEGRGMMLLEAYNGAGTNDEAAAVKILQRDIIQRMQAYSRAWPGAENYLAVIFSDDNQGPIYRVDSNPAVDYKYFLDLQFYLLANSPELHHVPGIGYWGNYYADEEHLRWSFELMRHYGVEGKKTMLSDEYGYKFFLPYVTNPDFADQLNGWTCQPAPEGKIEPYKNKNLASWQVRKGNGDPNGAVMTRSAKAPNILTQTAQGLIPGKLYTFQVFALDPDATRAPLISEGPTGPASFSYREIPFRADIDGVEIVRSYRYAAKHNNNCRYVIFRAQSDTATITLSDWQDEKTALGPAGQRTVFDYIKINPYFSTDAGENAIK